MTSACTRLAGLALVAIAAGLPWHTAAQQSPGTEARQLWTHEAPGAIRRLAITAGGDLLVGSSKGLVVLDGGTGETVWSRADITDCAPEIPEPRYDVRCKHPQKHSLGFRFEAFQTPLLVGHNPEDGQLSILELETGKTVFDADGRTPGTIYEYWHGEGGRLIVAWLRTGEEYRFAGISSAGTLLWQARTSIVKDLIWLGSPAEGALFAYGKNADDKRVVAEIDLASGRLAWETAGVLTDDIDDGPTMVGGGGRWRQKPYRFAPLVADSPESIVLFVNKNGPMRFTRHGARLWAVEALAGEHPSLMHHANGAIYLIQKDDVFAIDTASGRVRWRYEPRSTPSGLEVHHRGLLVWSDATVELLDSGTGRPAWARPADIPDRWSLGWSPGVLFRPTYFGGPTPRLVTGDVAFVAGYRSLVSVDLQDGQARTVAAYSLQDREPIRSLEVLDGDLLLTSAQTIARFTRQGQPVFRRDFRPVRAGGWERAAAIGLSAAVGLAAAGANVYNPFNPVESVMYTAFKHRYASGTSDDACFLFDNGKGDEERRFGITCVERSNARDVGTLWVNVRNPEILVDPSTRRLFFRRDRSIVASSLAGLAAD